MQTLIRPRYFFSLCFQDKIEYLVAIFIHYSLVIVGNNVRIELWSEKIGWNKERGNQQIRLGSLSFQRISER